MRYNVRLPSFAEGRSVAFDPESGICFDDMTWKGTVVDPGQGFRLKREPGFTPIETLRREAARQGYSLYGQRLNYARQSALRQAISSRAPVFMLFTVYCWKGDEEPRVTTGDELRARLEMVVRNERRAQQNLGTRTRFARMPTVSTWFK